MEKHIDQFDEKHLKELDKFLDFEDEVILNYYQHNIVKKDIDKNIISKLFKNYSV